MSFLLELSTKRRFREDHRAHSPSRSDSGVHSPTLSGSSQLDAFRSLLPPAILIASPELGGISTTISAYESLLLRGYHLDSVLVLKEDRYENWTYFRDWFGEKGISVGVVESPPERAPTVEEDEKRMRDYYESIAPSSIDSGKETSMQKVVKGLKRAHEDRIAELQSAGERALKTAWWPFTQHTMSEKKGAKEVMIIDSAHGDFFTTLNNIPPSSSSSADPTTTPPTSLLQPTFDSSASWWTQALGHAHPALTLAAASASARYGHVIYTTSTHLPALQLSEKLLSTVGKDWAERVFYSDDGSTGTEVGLKMALGAFRRRNEIDISDREASKLAIIGLKGAYHGDTIGAMDACDGNVYNDNVEWYEGKGFWFEPPQVWLEDGKVTVRVPGEATRSTSEDRKVTYGSFEEVYEVDKRVENDPLVEVYRKTISEGIKEYQRAGGVKLGALIIEPIVMGAGGMIFVDPLFQRVLLDVVRTDRELFPEEKGGGEVGAWSGLPVIFDEVFVGLRRLGRETTSSFLSSAYGQSTSWVQPDVAVYAKILTGGLLPMAVTLASKSVFDAFRGEKKEESLLHGHSYTAHPIGCQVSLKTLEILDEMEKKDAWGVAKDDWTSATSTSPPASTSTEPSSSTSPAVWSLWSHSFVQKVSHLPNVAGIMTLGTVLCIYLRPPPGSAGGYGSLAAESVLTRLRSNSYDAVDEVGSAGLPFNIHARPLGNVLYFMSSLNTGAETLRRVERGIEEAVQKAQ